MVDLSADFRLKSAETYEQWYKVEHKRPDLLPEAVYGLPELYASDIAKARLVANPGCYPTSIILGMTAALADGLIETHGIVADSKSGVSGAGRSAKLGSLYCEVADSFKAYGIGTHRHTPEIEQELSRLAHEPMTISFNPHLVPMNRGILSTIYAQLKAPLSHSIAQRVYEETWADSPWVRVLPSGQLPETRNVRGTMFCDMSVIVDPRTNRLIVENNPTVEELKAWIPLSGLPVKKFFNTSGLVYKELNLKEKLTTMSEEEQIALLATNGKLVKRPLVVTDHFVLVGFKPDEWEKLK